jgi:hypothetical protein
MAALFSAGCGSESSGTGSEAPGGAGPGLAGGGQSSAGGSGASSGATSGGVSAGGGAGNGGSAVTAGVGGGAGAAGAGGVDPAAVIVVMFLIDGLQPDAAATAMNNGADNLKQLVDNGVRVETAHSTSPAPRLELPDGSLPWGNSTSGNVSMHTGTHLFESRQMDDIFLSARKAGIKSVFSGADPNYAEFDTPDFHYADDFSDEQTLKYALDHFEQDGARLLRLHFQRIRDDWSGPAGKTDPTSAYVKHLVAIDALLGQLIQRLEDGGVWDSTYVIVSADHGMGTAAGSEHPSSTRSSWDTFMAFYGPGIKHGATIPYAENPDVPVTVNHLFGLPPLQGHTDPNVDLPTPGATGTLLSNLFEGEPDDLPHPRYIEQYLAKGTFAQNEGYADYRTGMLDLIK